MKSLEIRVWKLPHCFVNDYLASQFDETIFKVVFISSQLSFQFFNFWPIYTMNLSSESLWKCLYITRLKRLLDSQKTVTIWWRLDVRLLSKVYSFFKRRQLRDSHFFQNCNNFFSILAQFILCIFHVTSFENVCT